MLRTTQRRVTAQRGPFQFVALQPLSPAQGAQFAALTDLVVEAATWFFEDRQSSNGRRVPPNVTHTSLKDLLDAVEAGTTMLVRYFLSAFYKRTIGRVGFLMKGKLANAQGLGAIERNDVRGAYNRAEYLPERRAIMQQYAECSRRFPRARK